MGYFYIFLTIIFTVYGQLILKWRIGLKGAIPEENFEKLIYFKNLFFDLWILSGFASAFIASIAWMATLTKFDLSFAYPFMSLAFVIVFFFSVLLFQETITLHKIVGLFLVLTGLILISR